MVEYVRDLEDAARQLLVAAWPWRTMTNAAVAQSCLRLREVLERSPLKASATSSSPVREVADPLAFQSVDAVRRRQMRQERLAKEE